ncbi:MAG: phosphoribosylglycinamide formyltransferase [Saprospiraceae bacterium]|nr:phosphoribosylglycinamide formyltransferase [Saprospiraceae bacterium]
MHYNSKVKHIAIFASGTGSNARKIIDYFEGHPQIRVAVVVSNRPDAPVLGMAESKGVQTLVINRDYLYHSEQLLADLGRYPIDLVVLAGFLWLVPPYLVKAYRGKIVNIHPALLPKYGGKGMYGSRVHEAVKAAGETASGITIHHVNEHYDEGDIILQVSCPIGSEDTPATIAGKVQQLEYQHFAPVIESLLIG